MHLEAIPSRQRSRPSRLPAAALVAALVAACGGGAPTPQPSYPAGSIVVTAENRLFDTTVLTFSADTPATLVLVNRDGDAHNIAIRTQAGFDGDVVFRHDPVSSKTVVLEVPAIAGGSYFFLCEVHPAMAGTVSVN